MMAGAHTFREKRYGKDAYFRDPENIGSTGGKGCHPRSGVRLFLEIRFDEPNHATTVIDEEFQQFDDYR